MRKNSRSNWKRWVGLALSLMLMLSVAGCSGPEPKVQEDTVDRILKKYCNALETGENGSALEEDMPGFARGEEGYDAQAMKTTLDETFSGQKKAWERKYGEGYTVTYQITSEDKMTQDELKDYKEKIKGAYPDYDSEKITEAKSVDVLLTIKGKDKDGKELTQEEPLIIYFIREEGRWRLSGGL